MRGLDELSALWSNYKYAYLRDGRVVSWDEGEITTSEGQGYALLRAVWQKDPSTFRSVWSWTQRHLQVRGEDRLFAWKWRGRVLDRNAATDADTDIALALLLASREFSEAEYLEEALRILSDIWRKEVVRAGDGRHYVTAGNWAALEAQPTIHVAYLAPYAYEFFAEADPRFPWKSLVESSYRVLHWLYDDQKLKLPPETLKLDRRTGALELRQASAVFSYDAFPLFWRVAVDARWHSRPEGALRKEMLRFFQKEWRNTSRFRDRYSLQGESRSAYEGLPLYATVQSLAAIEDPALARAIQKEKLDALWSQGLSGRRLVYYLQNWLWFGRALELEVVRTNAEFLSFLRPFDWETFELCFPWAMAGLMLALFVLARYHVAFKLGFLGSGFYLCARYLAWRLTSSLNFLETSGPVISLLLWLAEAYCFSTVLLLLLQVGLKGGKHEAKRPIAPAGFLPSVDIYIPIYSESCEILEKTLIAARAMRYGNKRIHVCDDSRRAEVQDLAERYGANYIRGPKKHAKAGNLNNAISKTDGELLVVFDTDHIPVGSFLEETIPHFADPQLGIVQTPHHFYNEDIFQRAFGVPGGASGGSVPNEQDMFNHGIQGGRNSWGGSFFVGSGAVFRRKAIEGLGGFKLMSITEDIHTSQHLHAAGWKSAFVDKDLAVGLSAENFASFLVQRVRWMQGCLQILFKDNPLFCRGLRLRHRLGYFASLYYFLFPIPRLIFWAAPLCFLLFHWHPIFAHVSVLIAYLVPYAIALPLLSSVLLPGWPRAFWGVLYETCASFVLFRSMFDLLLPKTLGFKVTPKGIVSEKRSFDASASKANLIAFAITLFAMGKGAGELALFGIEKDAYFFNLAWAGVNLFYLAVSLLIAWERPQRRVEERIRLALPFTLEAGGMRVEGETCDVSLSGFAFRAAKPERARLARELPREAWLTLRGREGGKARCRVQLASQGSRGKYGFRFVEPDAEAREALLLMTFAAESTWAHAHEARARGNGVMIWHFFVGIVRCLKPSFAWGKRPAQAPLESGSVAGPIAGATPGLLTVIPSEKADLAERKSEKE